MGEIIDIEQVKQMQQKVGEKVHQEKQAYVQSQPASPGPIPSSQILKGLENNEDGDAQLLTQLFRGRRCYDHAEGKWYLFAGHYWHEDRVQESLKSLEDLVRVYGQEANNQVAIQVQAVAQGDKGKETKAATLQKGLLDRIRNLQKLHRKYDVLTLAAAGKDSLGITGQEWDKKPWLLGCANGVVDLRSGHFRDGSPGDYLRTATPTNWQDLEAPAERWEKFLQEIFDGDQELVDFMHRLFGCALIGEVKEHVFPIFWGQGRNGKGTLLETLKLVLGDLAGPLPSETLLEQRYTRSGAAPSPDIMRLRGQRIVWASETGEGRRLNLDKMKWLVGGDTITGRQVYGTRQIEFTPTHTLFLLTNHKPELSADDYAAWQRLLLIPFTLSFVDDPQTERERTRDPDLLEKLKAEAPGILAWLVKGCLRFQEEGLNPPECVKRATQDYQNEVDTYGYFLDDCCVQKPETRIKAGEFYRSYEQWCSENGHKAENSTKFGKKMTKKFTKIREGNWKFYHGVGLIDKGLGCADEDR